MKNNFYFLLMFLFAANSAFAQHENCNHGSAPDSGVANADSPFVQIPAHFRDNINLRVEKVKSGNIDVEISAIGKVEALPASRSEVTTRISGRVIKVFVQPFERVKSGAPMFEIESRAIGNPPPRITVYAPSDGIVESVDAVRGGAIEPATRLASIVDDSKLYAVANVFESGIGKLKIGQSAAIRFEAFPSKVFKGKLVKIGSSLNESNSTLPVYFELDNADSMIKTGMRARFAIAVDGRSAAVLVPNSALSGDFSNRKVFVQKCDKDLIFEKRDVIVGNSSDSQSEILSGLKSGEDVAVGGVYQLQFMPPAKENSHSEHSSAASSKSEKHADDHDEAEHAKKEHVHSASCSHGRNWFESDYFRYLLYSLFAVSVLLNFVFVGAEIIRSRNGRK